MSFSDLKKNKGNVFNQLQKTLEQGTKVGTVDERFWKPSPDKAGNGFAIIRFLPTAEGEDMPFVKLFSHAFQGPGGWYIENSLTTLGKNDPCGEYNRELWNSGDQALQDQVVSHWESHPQNSSIGSPRDALCLSTLHELQ